MNMAVKINPDDAYSKAPDFQERAKKSGRHAQMAALVKGRYQPPHGRRRPSGFGGCG